MDKHQDEEECNGYSDDEQETIIKSSMVIVMIKF